MMDKHIFESKIRELQREGKTPKEISDIIRGYWDGFYEGKGQKVKIYRMYKLLRSNDFNVEDAFDTLKKILRDQGIKPEDFGLKHDPNSFNTAYNRWKSRQNKKL